MKEAMQQMLLDEEARNSAKLQKIALEEPVGYPWYG